MLVSYEYFGGFNEHSSTNLPSKGAVSKICEDLLQLLFQGFHDTDALVDGTLAQVTAERMLSVVRRLQEQVRKSVRIGDPKTPTGKTVPIMKKFVHAIPAVRELLKHDLEATAIQQLAHRL